jgi:hypothetical protein
LPAQPNVDAANHVPLGKFRGIPHIQQLCTGVSQPDHFVERNGLQNPLQVAVQRYGVECTASANPRIDRASVGLVLSKTAIRR